MRRTRTPLKARAEAGNAPARSFLSLPQPSFCYAFAGDFAAERTRADKAIAAFASLADKLDALAAERFAALVVEAHRNRP